MTDTPALSDARQGLETAKQYLEDAQEMLGRDSNDTSAKVSQAIAMSRVSLSLREFQVRDAIAIAQKALQTFDSLIASGKSTPLITSNRATTLQRLAAGELKAGQALQARRSADSGRASMQTLTDGNEVSPGDVVTFVQIILVMADARVAVGDMQRAESLFRKACDLASKPAARHELPGVLAPAESQQRLGDLYHGLDKNDAARACYRRLAELWEGYPEKNSYVTQQETNAARLPEECR